MAAGRLRIGTRRSKLALWQAGWVADRLREELPDHEIEVVPVATRGDAHTGSFTGASGEIGFFTSEIEASVARGRVDLGVHSLKDLPTSNAGRIPVAAVPLRHDAADVLVAREGRTLADLEGGARVGTSSPRRSCLLRSLRGDIQVVPLRGNVDGRVRKLESGEYDAIVLAAAGLLRLGLQDLVTERFDPTAFPPAPGQGALAIQIRDAGSRLADVLSRLDDPAARQTTTAERTCLEELGGGCARPIGAYASAAGGSLELSAFVGSEDGARIVRAVARGDQPEELGRRVASELRRAGAEELLA